MVLEEGTSYVSLGIFLGSGDYFPEEGFGALWGLERPKNFGLETFLIFLDSILRVQRGMGFHPFGVPFGRFPRRPN